MERPSVLDTTPPLGVLMSPRRLVASVLVASGLSIAGCASGVPSDNKGPLFEQLNSVEPCGIASNIPVESITLRDSVSTDHGEMEASGFSRVFDFSHVVQEGDTLGKIASCYFEDTNVGLASILAANPDIQDPNVILPGHQIQIFVTSPVGLVSAEPRTWEEIALVSGFDPAVLASVNRMGQDQVIEAGSVYVLPRQRRPLTGDSNEVVQIGDTYSSLARDNNIGVVALQATNPMIDTELIPGQVVTVPGAESSLVNPSDVDVSNQSDAADEPLPPSAELPAAEQLRQFIEAYMPYAELAEDECGIPAELILAQAVHESDYGRSELAVQARNFTGIKAGESWEGDTYIKLTEEFLTPEALAALREQGIETEELGETADGLLRVRVPQAFRKYASVEEGFLGYAEKILERGYYTDATQAGDPFLALDYLTDDIGPAYATNPVYRESVEGLIIRVQQLLQEMEAVGPQEEADSNEELGGSVGERIEAMNLTIEGYKAFVDSIDTSYMDFAAGKESYNPDLNGVPQEAPEFVVLHYTALYFNGRDQPTDRPIGNEIDVEHFVTSTNNTGVGVQFLIGRDATTYQLTDLSVRAANVKPHSSVAVGVEIEAPTQEEITTEQYEAAAYWAAYVLRETGLLVSGKSIDELLVGHAEIRAADILANPDAGLQGRSDFAADVSGALREGVMALISSNPGAFGLSAGDLELLTRAN